MSGFIKRLWKRRVFQFGALYLGAAWLLLQVAVVIEQTLELPNWIDQVVLALLIIGFPLALILAWAQDSQETINKSDDNPVKPTKPKSQSSEKLSIAVLPFLNLSEERDHEFFADGMTEDLLTALSVNQHMSVASRTSSFQYKGKSEDVRDIGQALNVDHVVEGSVRPMGDRVRITAQLIETRSGNHLWAEKYDRPLADLFDVQDDVVRSIASALNVSLSLGMGLRLVAAKPESLTSWQRVQEVSVRMHTGSFQEHQVAIDALEKVVSQEPGYAYATSLLAFAYLQRLINGNSVHPRKDFERALPLIEKGLTLAPSDPLNLYYCASAAGYSGQFERAIELAKRGLDINPNLMELYAPIAQASTQIGLFEQAQYALDRIKFIGQSFWKDGVIWYEAILRVAELHYEEALPLLTKSVQAMPEYAYARILLAIAQEGVGDDNAAAKTIEQVHELSPDLNMRGIKATLRSYKYPVEGEADRRIALLEGLWEQAKAV